jgi:diketogulonate reductase-like aldo/keto reductase
LKTVKLPTGEQVSAFGLGTWRMGDDRAHRKEELATLQLGLDLGATLIDTAEMYGDGLAEELVGEAIEGRRDAVFLVSKVLPQNASRQGVVAACQRSLKRLKTDCIDLYLLHWPGSVPLSETIAGFIELQKAGKIRHYGVSNFDVSEMQQLWKLAGGPSVATNQILYNLSRRNVEWNLLPWLRERKIPIMAYSPLEQARLIENKKLSAFAARGHMTPAQSALAWLLTREDIIVIPKTSSRERLKENLGSLTRTLSSAELSELDQLFPPPSAPHPLEML